MTQADSDASVSLSALPFTKRIAMVRLALPSSFTPPTKELLRTLAFWLAALGGSVAVVIASTAFVADATASFMVAAVPAQVAKSKPVQHLADVTPKKDAAPAPMTVNGPPPIAREVASAVAPVAVAPVVPKPVAPKSVVPAPVEGSTMVVSTTTGLNVRAEPRSGSAKVGTLESGTTVAALDEQGPWTRIETPTLEGWVFTKYLSTAVAQYRGRGL